MQHSRLDASNVVDHLQQLAGKFMAVLKHGDEDAEEHDAGEPNGAAHEFKSADAGWRKVWCLTYWCEQSLLCTVGTH